MWTPPGGALPIFVLTVGSGGPRRRNLSKSRASAVPGTPLLAFTGPKKPFGVRVLVPPRSADTPFASLRSLRECREETSSRSRTPAVGRTPRSVSERPERASLPAGNVPFERRGGSPAVGVSRGCLPGTRAAVVYPLAPGDRPRPTLPPNARRVSEEKRRRPTREGGADIHPSERPVSSRAKTPAGRPIYSAPDFRSREVRQPSPPVSSPAAVLPFPGAALPFSVAVGPRPRLPRGTFSAGRARNLSKISPGPNSDLVRGTSTLPKTSTTLSARTSASNFV